MEVIYIDDAFKCHVFNDGTFREVVLSESARDFFDGKCDAFIEGYRFVPAGESWTRSDGVVFTGEMIAPWKPYKELDSAQREYERKLLKELQENSILVSDLEAAYQGGVNSV